MVHLRAVRQSRRAVAAAVAVAVDRILHLHMTAAIAAEEVGDAAAVAVEARSVADGRIAIDPTVLPIVEIEEEMLTIRLVVHHRLREEEITVHHVVVVLLVTMVHLQVSKQKSGLKNRNSSYY
jgi:hypothetical protein